MRVDVDKAGGDHPSGGVDLFLAVARKAAHGGDLSAADRNIADKAGLAAAIDDSAIAQD